MSSRARRVQDFWTRTRFIEYFRTRDPDPDPDRYFFTCLTFENFFLVFTSGGRSKN
jgi:hypothetical protein